MKSEILKRIIKINTFDELVSRLSLQAESHSVVYCSSLYGVSKSSLAIKLSEIENQIVLLLPDSKSAEELFVELNLLQLPEQLITSK